MSFWKALTARRQSMTWKAPPGLSRFVHVGARVQCHGDRVVLNEGRSGEAVAM